MAPSWLLFGCLVFLSTATLPAGCCSPTLGDSLGDAEFQAWKNVANPAGYSSLEEEQYRYAIYLLNRGYINELNAQNLGFKVELNKFADRTPDEMAVLRGLRVPVEDVPVRKPKPKPPTSKHRPQMTTTTVHRKTTTHHQQTTTTRHFKTTTHQHPSTTTKQRKSTPTTTTKHHKSTPTATTPITTKHHKITTASSPATTSTVSSTSTTTTTTTTMAPLTTTVTYTTTTSSDVTSPPADITSDVTSPSGDFTSDVTSPSTDFTSDVTSPSGDITSTLLQSEMTSSTEQIDTSTTKKPHKKSTTTRSSTTMMTTTTTSSPDATTTIQPNSTMTSQPDDTTTLSPPSTTVQPPSSLDWRAKGAVTPVKDQGNCGSCWAFSATGALEGRLQVKWGPLISLSEQNFIDCSSIYGNSGCDGGSPSAAFQYDEAVQGINTEAVYAYKAKAGNCKFHNASSARFAPLSDTPFKKVSNNEAALVKALEKGPVSIAIDASQPSFTYYSSGIYSDANCTVVDLDHAMLLVGYGNDADGQGYWIVKNSWGTDWGEEGYVRVARGANTCGILEAALYPVLA